MANENKYTLPLGIDASSFFQGIATIDKSISTLQTGVADANKGMQDAFSKTTASGEKLEETLAGDIEKVKLLRDAAKAAGKDIAEALNPKGAGRELEDRISKFQTMLLKATKGSKISLDVVFNEATIRELQKGLKGASGEMEHSRTWFPRRRSNLLPLIRIQRISNPLQVRLPLRKDSWKALGMPRQKPKPNLNPFGPSFGD